MVAGRVGVWPKASVVSTRAWKVDASCVRLTLTRGSTVACVATDKARVNVVDADLGPYESETDSTADGADEANPNSWLELMMPLLSVASPTRNTSDGTLKTG